MYSNHSVWLPNFFHILSTRFLCKDTKIKFSFLFIRQKIFLYDIDMNDDGSGWHSKSYSNTTNRLTTERPRAIFVIGFLWYRWCWLCTLFICGAGIYSPQFPFTLWYPCVIVWYERDILKGIYLWLYEFLTIFTYLSQLFLWSKEYIWRNLQT